MKQNLWLLGAIIVVIASFGYAYAASSEKAVVWAVSTLFMVLGGAVLAAAFLTHHTLSGKKR